MAERVRTMDVDSETVQVLIQGGAVGLALVSIGGLIYALRMAFNHLSHIGEQLGASNAIQAGMLDAIERISDRLDAVTRNL